MDLLALQGRAFLRGGRRMGADPEGDGVAAEPPPGTGGKQRILRASGSLGQPDPQHDLDRTGERNRSLFASLAFAEDAGAGAQGDVTAVQPGELGDPQTGLNSKQQQHLISPTLPSGPVRGGDEGVDLGRSQECQDPSVEPFRRNRQHPLDEHGVLRMAQRGIGEQRSDRCQANVSGPDAVVPASLEVGEERGDRGGVQIVPVEMGWCPSGLFVHKPEEQSQGVAVGRGGAWARLPLLGKPIGEEGLQCRRDQSHDRAADHAVSWRAAARASSSGAADKYQ